MRDVGPAVRPILKWAGGEAARSSSISIKYLITNVTRRSV